MSSIVMRLMSTFIIVGAMFAFNNCTGGGGNSNGSSVGTLDENRDIDFNNNLTNDPNIIGGEVPAPDVDVDPNDPTIIDDDTVVTPGTDIGPNGITFQPPPDCEAACKIMSDCGNRTGAEKTRCEDACGTDEHDFCAPIQIHDDPLTLAGFTVPAGYTYRDVTVRHCTDRHDFMTATGTSLSFRTVVSNGGHGNEGATVGRASHCGARFRVPTREQAAARYAVHVGNYYFQGRTPMLELDSDGSPIIEDDSVREAALLTIDGVSQPVPWAQPDSTSFDLSQVILNIDQTRPTYFELKNMIGPGIKRYRILQNGAEESGRLTFSFEYHFFYDPTYETTFRLWYKPINTGSDE